MWFLGWMMVIKGVYIVAPHTTKRFFFLGVGWLIFYLFKTHRDPRDFSCWSVITLGVSPYSLRAVGHKAAAHGKTPSLAGILVKKTGKAWLSTDRQAGPLVISGVLVWLVSHGLLVVVSWCLKGIRFDQICFKVSTSSGSRSISSQLIQNHCQSVTWTAKGTCRDWPSCANQDDAMLTCILTLFSEMGSDPGYQLVEFYFERSKEISNSFHDDFVTFPSFNGLLRM